MYQVTWNETSASVAAHQSAGQYTAVSRQVDGSSNYVTWFTFEPSEITQTQWMDQFYVYQSNTAVESGVTITNFNNLSVELGNWYQFSDANNTWSLLSNPPSGQQPVPSNSIGLFYLVASGAKETTFGLQCLVAGSTNPTAICADTVFSNQAAIYTPLTTIFASMGKSYTTNTVIADIGNWDMLQFAGTSATALYDDTQSIWTLTSDSTSNDVNKIQLLLKAHADLCAAHALIADWLLGYSHGKNSAALSKSLGIVKQR